LRRPSHLRDHFSLVGWGCPEFADTRVRWF
jgi:hypothetical protein